MRRALIVIGKAPLAGQSKTRLSPPLSSDDAALLYRAFLVDTLELAKSLGWEGTSLIHPRGHAPLLRSLVSGVHLLEQPRNGLGHALQYAFEWHFAAGYELVVLIGSDSPTLGSEPIRASEAAIYNGADLVIGPTPDGGYYLIGMRQPHVGVFQGVAWSTTEVYAQTLRRAAELKLRVHSVDEWYDVDEPSDLDHLRRDLAASSEAVAAETRRALEAIAAARAH
jgi:rSAM/selenodomain-associated transferase 1